jgi:hypothetical protein
LHRPPRAGSYVFLLVGETTHFRNEDFSPTKTSSCRKFLGNSFTVT